VLGDAVTPEVAAAWDEVYWLFATQLVAEEARLYAAAHVEHVGRELDDFTPLTWYEQVGPQDRGARQGWMDLGDVSLPEGVQVFTCGPLPFMRHVRSTLLARGVPPTSIRYEVFGPDLWAQSPPQDEGALV
jgi:ferredoxin-NADP reductase